MQSGRRIDTVDDETVVDVRIKIAGLWTSTMFVFAYVDIFSFFRADVLNGALAGTVSIFTIDQSFLLITTVYILLSSLMVYLSLTLPAKINRWSNVILAMLYTNGH